ncbi:HEAT repeat domain-containing protein [Alcanivoracaceae bacterium MT1]
MITTLIEYFLLIILFLLFFLIVLIIYLSLKRRQEVVHSRKQNEFISNSKDDWYRFLIEGFEVKPSMIPEKTVDYVAAEQVLLTYKQNVYSRFTEENIRTYAETYLQSIYRKQLLSKNWSKRINALYRVLDFQMVCLKEELFRILNSDTLTKEEYIQICKILSKFQDPELIKQLNRPIFILGEYEYRKLVHELEEKQMDLLIEEFDQLTNNLQYAIIDWIEQHYAIHRYRLLEKLVVDEREEIRLRALKAMKEIGYVPNVNLIKQLVESEVWEERLMAAKLLMIVEKDVATPLLTILIEDPVWWVRNEAAGSIIKSQNGPNTLRFIIGKSSDPFAIDIATEVLQRSSAL